MKKILSLLFFSFLFFNSYSQTKILDASVNWSSPETLTVFLSDTLASAATVQFGTSFNGSNIVNATYTVGSNISCIDNMLVIPLSGVTPGSYYVDVRVTMIDETVKEMQFQCAD